MKLTKSKLKQLIKEVLEEGDVIKGPWEERDDDEGEELPAEFQYERILDELVDAARDAIMPLAVEKLEAAGALSEEEGRGLTYNDIELEIEEPLMDALKPLAKLIQDKVDHGPGREDEDEEEW
jgi:hypothetical protein